jgi:hypothetical protein
MNVRFTYNTYHSFYHNWKCVFNSRSVFGIRHGLLIRNIRIRRIRNKEYGIDGRREAEI